MKKLQGLGYEAYGIDMREFHARDSRLRKAVDWVMDYSIEILSVLGVILMAYLIGMLMQSVGQGVQAFSELLDEQQAQQEDVYQTEQVLKALVLKQESTKTN